MIDKCTEFVQRWLYPPCCVLCGRPGSGGRDLCAGCYGDLPWVRGACTRCARPLHCAADRLCGRCTRMPPPFAATIAPLRYRSPVDHLILGAKFGGRLQLTRLLGELLAEAAGMCELPRPEALLPVPLHPQRQRVRGYNQAVELARPVSRTLGLPLLTGACRRVRATASQTRLDGRARRANLRGAFAVTGALGCAHVAIVDDVMTTGSTVAALAQALVGAGVRRVDVWCVARADGG